MRSVRTVVLLSLLLILVLACDDRSIEVESLTIANVTVEPDTIVIIQGNTQEASEITATIVDDNNLVAEGESVLFTTDLGMVTSLGGRETLDSEVNIETNVEGEATILLYEHDQAGIATVDIMVSGDRKSVQVTFVEPGK